MVVFDFDGVFTNNLVFVSETGEESVLCNRSDGLGLKMLRSIGLPHLIISTETNPVVQMRAKKLKIECHAGYDDKLAKLKAVAEEHNCDLLEIAYVGNDINDLECMEVAGLPVAVADAYPEVKGVAKIILNTRGGYGAVREFCEMIYQAKRSANEKTVQPRW